MSEPALKTRGLCKRFGAITALRDLDLDVSAGQLLAVLGPNGAGKSTLLRLLAGLSRPTAGEIQIQGSPRSRRAKDRSRVGFVGHATLLYSDLSARENLVFAGRLYAVADPAARADELLEIEGLTDVANQRTGSFSRGMSQRLAIARALVHDPPILLLDEPFSGLDRRASERLAARLTHLRDGHTIVLVTHEARTASRVASSAVVLRRGAIVARFDGPSLDAEALERALDTPTERHEA